MMKRFGWKKAAALWMGIVMAASLVGCGSQGGDSQRSGESSSETRQESVASESAEESTAPESTAPESAEEGSASGGTEENPEESSTPEDAQESPAEGNSEEQTAQSDGAQEEGTGEAGKTLVVYYSATGNTENVAGYIAAATDADIFVLEPVEPYTSDDLDWTNADSRVSREHDNEDERNVELVATTVDDWDSYDTVFIGYPIWWHIAAWPVNGFVEANDFTGKTVIPFCTSSSSGLEESGELLAEAAGTGNWLEGERFSSGASEETVQEWVAGLNLQ